MFAMNRVALALTLLPVAAVAAPIGYAQSNSYFKKDTRPSLYQPLNLLDSREVTAWCTSGPDPLNDVLMFGFKGPTTIDEVRIYTGNGFDQNTFEQFARAKKFSIHGPVGGQTFSVADQRGFQSVPFNPPLTGSQFRVEILDLYPSEDLDQPVCVTDIVFFSEGKALNGSWLTQKLKYDKQQATVLGTWFGGYEGAPDKFLSFYFDGTYRYVFDPYDKETQKEKVFEGAYTVSGSRITLELPGKGKVSARLRREADPKKKGAFTLSLEGDLPEELKQLFRDAP